MLAARIGSWDDQDDPVEAPHEMLSLAIEYLDSNATEPVIGLGQWILSPQTMVRHFQRGANLDNILQEPRLFRRDEEATLHGLAGGLDTVIDVYDVGANEIVTFRPSRATPNSSRWIIRYPNGTYGAVLTRDMDGAGFGPLQDRGRDNNGFSPVADRSADIEEEGGGPTNFMDEAGNMDGCDTGRMTRQQRSTCWKERMSWCELSKTEPPPSLLDFGFDSFHHPRQDW